MKITATTGLFMAVLLVGCGESGSTTTATDNENTTIENPTTNSPTVSTPVDPTPTEPIGANPELPTVDPDSDGDGVIDRDDEFPNDASRAMGLKSAHRLTLQATFGPTFDDLGRAQSMGAERWVDEQLNAPSAYDSTTDNHRTHLERTIEIAEHIEPNTNWYGTAIFNQDVASFSADEYQMAAWWENAIGLHPTNTQHGSDQLRQRVAFALSQLLVVSSFEPPLNRRGEGLRITTICWRVTLLVITETY